MVQEIENFFGVYLLVSKSVRFKGQTYIGFTVNPNRRVKQHNAGREKGGAKRTSGRGPWDMVLIVHGFPNQISALRFEWAWQNPTVSRRLKTVVKKRRTENRFEYRFRVMCEMLRARPWCRLPLTLRWLIQDYHKEFDCNLMPPNHMPVAYGPVSICKVAPAGSEASQMSDGEGFIPLTQPRRPRCHVCHNRMEESSNMVKCPLPGCKMAAHTLCLAQQFLAVEGAKELIPVEGSCPGCKQAILWGDIIRYKMGCYQNLQPAVDDGTEANDDSDV